MGSLCHVPPLSSHPRALSKPVSPGSWVHPHNLVHLQRVCHSLENPPGGATGPRIPHSPHRLAHHYGKDTSGLLACSWLNCPPCLKEGCGAEWGSNLGPPAHLPHLKRRVLALCADLGSVPDPHGAEEGGPGIGGAVWVLAALLSLASYQHRPAVLTRGKWGAQAIWGSQSVSFSPRVPSFLLPFPHTACFLCRHKHHSCLNSSDSRTHSLP